MTSDDTDTGQGNEVDPEGTASSNQESNGPPRDPETGEFLSKDERSEGESEPATERRETESETMDDEPGTESEPRDEAHDQVPEPTVETYEADAEPRTVADEAQGTDTSAAVRETMDAGTESGVQRTASSGNEQAAGAAPHSVTSIAGGVATAQQSTSGSVFVPNPNGYPRPPATYLPMLPWLRLSSRAPAYETVSV